MKDNSINFTKIIEHLSLNTEFPNLIENNNWHNNEHVLSHCLRVFENLKMLYTQHEFNTSEYLSKKVGRFSKRELLLTAGLLHDIGKLTTTKYFMNKSISKNHEIEGGKYVKHILKNNQFQKIEINYIANIISHHGEINGLLNVWGNSNFNYLFKKFKKNNKYRFLELVLLMLSDTINGDYKKITLKTIILELNSQNHF